MRGSTSGVGGWGLLAAALLALGVARPAGACSTCLAGDPSFSAHGTSAQGPGSFSAYLELRGFRETSGHLDHDAHHAPDPHHDPHDPHAAHHEPEPAHEREVGQRLDLYLSWTPVDRATLTLDLPFARNEIVEYEGADRTRSTLSGLGDVSLSGSFVLWRDREVLPSTWVEARSFVKAPTGRSRRTVDGSKDPHLQTGTGSWDFGGGLAVTHRLAWGSLYGSVFYRENTEGALDYEYGDVLFANAAVEVPLGHALGAESLARFTTGLELNFRYAEFDVSGGERFDDSGGAILYATPSLRIRLPELRPEKPPSLRLAVQLPLSQTWLHNQQRKREVWSVGLYVPL